MRGRVALHGATTTAFPCGIIASMLKMIAATMVFSVSAMAGVRIEKTNYKGWPNSYRIWNGEVELIITSDIGPRIMRYAFPDGQNVFKEFADTLGKSGEANWQLRGGHRIWFAPEDAVKTYAPDNGPVHISVKGEVLEATEPVEPLTGLEKQIRVKMSPAGTGVEVLHRIRNTNKTTIELAPWALSMMAPGGVGIHGFPTRGTHPEVLAPTNPLVMWAFTDLTDRRWQFTRKYLMLRQDPNYHRQLRVVHQTLRSRPQAHVSGFRGVVRDFHQRRFSGAGDAGPDDAARSGRVRRPYRALDAAQERPHPRMDGRGTGPCAVASGSEVVATLCQPNGI